MQKLFLKELQKITPFLFGIIATVLSTFILFTEFINFKIFPITISIFASILGATIVFIFIRFKTIASAPTIFISYTSQDKDFAIKLAQALENIPIKVLINEREFRVGDNIQQKIYNLIDNADYFAFVVSKSSMKSEWAKKELSMAIEKKKRILPILLDREALPPELEGIVYADFTKSFDKGIQQLRRSFTRQT